MAGKEGLSHLMHLTREVMPRIDNYRDIFKSTTRPSIDELHESSAPEQVKSLHLPCVFVLKIHHLNVN